MNKVSNKVATYGGVGVAVTLVLQLCQQYIHGFVPPSASTISTIVTVLGVVGGWMVKEEPQLIQFIEHKPLDPPALVQVSNSPVPASANTQAGPVEGWPAHE